MAPRADDRSRFGAVVLVLASLCHVPPAWAELDAPATVSSRARVKIDAGTDQTITWPAEAKLRGRVIGGRPATLSWSKASGPGEVIFSDPSAIGTSAKFSEPGVYGVRLSAADRGLMLTDDLTIIVAANQPPTAKSQQLTTAEDTPLPLTLLASDPERDPLAYRIITPPAHGAISQDPMVYRPERNFSGPDTFRFIATDATGQSLPATVGIVVTPVNDLPTAVLQVAPTRGPVPLTIHADASASTDVEDPLAGYAWDFGDGTSAAGPIVDHEYAKPASYTLRLTVMDSAGATDVARQLISVFTPPTFLQRREAEAVRLSAPMKIVADDGALGGRGITSPSLKGSARWTLTVPSNGIYALWVRAWAPTRGADTLLTKLDAEDEVTLTIPEAEGYARWRWVGLVSAVSGSSMRLSAGVHTVRLRAKDAGVRMDQLLVTNEPTYVPGDE